MTNSSLIVPQTKAAQLPPKGKQAAQLAATKNLIINKIQTYTAKEMMIRRLQCHQKW